MFEGLLQPWHLLIVLLIVLVIFGPGKLAGVGGALGKTIKDFRSSMEDDTPSQQSQPTETIIKTQPPSDVTKTTTTVITSDNTADGRTHVRT